MFSIMIVLWSWHAHDQLCKKPWLIYFLSSIVVSLNFMRGLSSPTEHNWYKIQVCLIVYACTGMFHLLRPTRVGSTLGQAIQLNISSIWDQCLSIQCHISNHLRLQLMCFTCLDVVSSCKVSSTIIAHSVMPLRTSPIVIHNIGTSQTSIHSSSIKALDPPMSIMYHLWTLYRIASIWFNLPTHGLGSMLHDTILEISILKKVTWNTRLATTRVTVTQICATE